MTRWTNPPPTPSKAYALRAIAASIAKFEDKEKASALLADAIKTTEGLGNDENRDKVLESILVSKLAIADVARLRSLASKYSSDAGKAKAMARILKACSHPELIGKEKEPEDGNNR